MEPEINLPNLSYIQFLDPNDKEKIEEFCKV